MIVFIDDILVYSKSIDDHVIHVRRVLEILKVEKLYANLKSVVFAWIELISLVLLLVQKG